MSDTKTLDFRGSMWDCRSRMLWQVLFDYYREQGCPLERMDNMLCDHTNCVKLSEGFRHEPVIFMWGCDSGCFLTWWVESSQWEGQSPEWFASWQCWDFAVLVEVGEELATFRVCQTASESAEA